MSDEQIQTNRKTRKRAKQHHMAINWHNLTTSTDDVPATEAPLAERATFVGRVGLLQLSAGSGAWRTRDAMNTVAKALGLTCTQDIGLISINYTCVDGAESFSESLTLKTTGVNTDKLMEMSLFVKKFPEYAGKYSIDHLHELLDQIKNKPSNYSVMDEGLAAGFACMAFTFLLGGGPWEMLFALIGAAVGNYVRVYMVRKGLSLFFCVATGVAAGCAAYIMAISLCSSVLPIDDAHQAGYICAMLFIIPGFPLITGGLDIFKVEMRSGLERLTYALMIITIATITGCVVATILNFHPSDFVELSLNPYVKFALRLLFSFIGVYGFSLMFNSPKAMAAAAGFVGMIANTTRLTLVDLGIKGITAGVAAFIGAFIAGVIASKVRHMTGYPRIALTVPSIVIMVPGLYMYRGIYYMGTGASITDAATWLTRAFLIVLALPLGLSFARLVTDKNFRYCS